MISDNNSRKRRSRTKFSILLIFVYFFKLFTITWSVQNQKGKTCLKYETLINLSTQMSRSAARLHCNSRKSKFPCRIWDNVPFLKVRHHVQCVNTEVQTWASLVLHWGSSFLIPKENVLFNNCNITDLSQQPVDWLYNLSLCCSIVCLQPVSWTPISLNGRQAKGLIYGIRIVKHLGYWECLCSKKDF